MEAWLTYSPSDLLLFSAQTYHRLFELYNADFWPIPLLSLAGGAMIATLIWWKPVGQGRTISAMLAACWLWIAWAYHLQHYATINWAAPGFAVGFAAQGLLLLWSGVVRGRLAYRAAVGPVSAIGLGIFGFALVVYPLLAPLLGRGWMQAEFFGAAPDPTAVATLGLMLLTTRRISWMLMIVPVIWCAVSGVILAAMGSPLAFVVPAAAPIVLAAAVWKIRKT